MKILLLISFLALVILTIEGKGHHANGHQHRVKETETPKLENEEQGPHVGEPDDKSMAHETTNRMHSETKKRGGKPVSGGTQKQKQANGQQDSHAIKAHNDETSLHRYAFEHNVDKKQMDDQKGIPMEQEHLIHVTPVPPKAKPQKSKTGEKISKGQKNRHPTAAGASTGAKNQTKPAKGGRKIPKKFNKKLHNLKKSLKKDKSDKQNEKRERKMKKLKALHRATTTS